MSEADKAEKLSSQNERPPVRLRLPGLVADEIGLGDAIARVTTAVGLQPCGGCEARAAALNRWMIFSR